MRASSTCSSITLGFAAAAALAACLGVVGSSDHEAAGVGAVRRGDLSAAGPFLAPLPPPPPPPPGTNPGGSPGDDAGPGGRPRSVPESHPDGVYRSGIKPTTTTAGNKAKETQTQTQTKTKTKATPTPTPTPITVCDCSYRDKIDPYFSPSAIGDIVMRVQTNRDKPPENNQMNFALMGVRVVAFICGSASAATDKAMHVGFDRIEEKCGHKTGGYTAWVVDGGGGEDNTHVAPDIVLG
ncbi:hypothetical protein O9K51_00081 [Purpureocillium lavendulum]|uniref:Rhodanese domain-containing protein n=1 Tax=Purpureocillium lavendulum TaxID=1247861 RepID=A0AB34G3M8_9HYPO|nr:hypothetical protein O9K51_00081 [Purpureocillium lavendulum]